MISPRAMPGLLQNPPRASQAPPETLLKLRALTCCLGPRSPLTRLAEHFPHPPIKRKLGIGILYLLCSLLLAPSFDLNSLIQADVIADDPTVEVGASVTEKAEEGADVEKDITSNIWAPFVPPPPNDLPDARVYIYINIVKVFREVAEKRVVLI